MSIDEPPVVLLRWCKDRSGIRLTSDFLKDWYRSRNSTTQNTELIYNELVTTFLNRDISTTSEAVIPDNFGNLTVDTFPPGHLRQGGGVILQIQDTIDISHSTFSLLNVIQNAVPVRSTYVEREEGDDFTYRRGTLRWTLTDGSKQIQAMEFETIPELDLKTPFGCKILVKNCQVRRGMLLLDKNNVKVLGGDVPELYGGNMTAELEKRFKMKLGMIDPSSTQAPETDISGSTLVTGDSLVNEIADFDDDTTYNDFDDMNYNDFNDDDINYNDFDDSNINYNDIDVFDSMYSENNTENKEIGALGPQDIQDPFDDEDYFDAYDGFNNVQKFDAADPDIEKPYTDTPTLESLANKVSTANSSTLKLSEESNTTSVDTHPPPSSSNNKRTRDRYEEDPTDIPPNKNKGKSKAIDPGSDQEDHSRELSWVDSSVWDNLERTEVVDMDIDHNGKAQCTFEVLKKTLKAMEKGTYAGTIADTIVAKVKCIKLAKLRMSSLSGFHLEIQIGDPVNESLGTIKAVFNNEILTKLLGVEQKDVIQLNKAEGQKAVAKKIFKPFEAKITSTLALLEFDLTVLESEASSGVDSKSLMPLVTNYEACS